jgi:alanine-glyoxylate transaminase/serine-glyoxylate transaminase/serine-pyruvate transaminase
LHEVLPELNFRLASQQGHRLPQLTTAWLPEGADDAALRKGLLDTYGIEVGGGLGEFAGLAWRIGLMGNSARERSVTALLGALRELIA